MENLLINKVLALSCPSDGDEGLDDQITNIEIVSNAKFNDYDAGQPLNDIILVDRYKVEEWLSFEYRLSFEYYNLMLIAITDKPKDTQFHKFTIKMFFESGRVLEKETEEINWR